MIISVVVLVFLEYCRTHDCIFSQFGDVHPVFENVKIVNQIFNISEKIQKAYNEVDNSIKSYHPLYEDCLKTFHKCHLITQEKKLLDSTHKFYKDVSTIFSSRIYFSSRYLPQERSEAERLLAGFSEDWLEIRHSQVHDYYQGLELRNQDLQSRVRTLQENKENAVIFARNHGCI